MGPAVSRSGRGDCRRARGQGAPRAVRAGSALARPAAQYVQAVFQRSLLRQRGVKWRPRAHHGTSEISETLCFSERETEQVLNQVVFFTGREPQTHACVVVIDDGIQRREAAVMIETAFGMREDGADW